MSPFFPVYNWNIFLRVSVDLQMYIVNMITLIKNAKQCKIVHLILSILRTKELVNNCSKVDCFSDINIKALQLTNIELTVKLFN